MVKYAHLYTLMMKFGVDPNIPFTFFDSKECLRFTAKVVFVSNLKLIVSTGII